jgi:hypothetical protein
MIWIIEKAEDVLQLKKKHELSEWMSMSGTEENKLTQAYKLVKL